MAHAQPTAAGGAALAERQGAMRLPRPSRRQVAVLVLVAGAVAAVLTVTGGPMAELTQAFERALHADRGWAAAGVAFEAASLAGYVALFWLVAGRATRAIGPRESAEIGLSGAAATRLLPTGGLGGVALTLWALARAGLPARAAVRALLTFLVILYSVFMGALAVAGLVLLTGVAPGDGLWLPAMLGAVAIAGLRKDRGAMGGRARGRAPPAVRRSSPRT